MRLPHQRLEFDRVGAAAAGLPVGWLNAGRMVLRAGLGAISSTLGIYLSYYFDWPTGPAIALVVFVMFLLALLFSPSQGILTHRKLLVGGVAALGRVAALGGVLRSVGLSVAIDSNFRPDCSVLIGHIRRGPTAK